MRKYLLAAFALAAIAGCARDKSDGGERKQFLEFNGFTVEDGVYKPKPGWNFTPGKDGTIVVAKDNATGGVISPCECAIEGDGSCSQASSEDPITGDIREIWCVDQGCGFCVGGVQDPDEPANHVKFDVVCKDRKVSQ